jgi:hypothetical protein
MDGRTALIAAAVALFGPMPAADTADIAGKRSTRTERDETARSPAVVVVMPDHAAAIGRIGRPVSPAMRGTGPLQMQPAAPARERQPATRLVSLSL